ncbi:hypothetical protein I315_02084, partial [Cryptococcus gattii Ru294]
CHAQLLGMRRWRKVNEKDYWKEWKMTGEDS